MKEITDSELHIILKEKGLDPKIGWFCLQFKKKFEDEWVIDHIDLEQAIENLIAFLNKDKIEEILFFTEPSEGKNDVYGEYRGQAFIKTDELKPFLFNNFDSITNSHVAGKDLDWIFTLTHEEDFFIAGKKDLVKEFIGFYKDANCTHYKDIEKKWAKQ